MALQKGQQYTPAQIYAEDPNWLKTNNPSLYAQFTSQVGQPAASLQNTQASTPGITANSAVDSATVGSKVSSINSDAVVAAQKANAAKFLTDVTNNFAKAAKDNGGKVPPQYYNEVKGEAGQFGIDSPTFDSSFRANYVDPSKEIQYNTEQGNQIQNDYSTLKRQIQATIDNFTSIPVDQKQAALTGQDQVIGNQRLSNIIAPDAASYENSRNGFSAQLSALAGGGSGSGLRISQTELNRWGNLLPSTKNSDAANAKNIAILDSELRAKFNIPKGLDSNYYPGNGSGVQNPQIQGILNAGSSQPASAPQTGVWQ
jgi:hypothetical protein